MWDSRRLVSDWDPVWIEGNPLLKKPLVFTGALIMVFALAFSVLRFPIFEFRPLSIVLGVRFPLRRPFWAQTTGRGISWVSIVSGVKHFCVSSMREERSRDLFYEVYDKSVLSLSVGFPPETSLTSTEISSRSVTALDRHMYVDNE